MKAVIMQPSYLSWLGFFDLMDQSDIFVFLDHIQYTKRSWQQRNKIKTPQGELWLTIPIKSKGKYEQKISETLINDSNNWKDKHLQSIKMNYAKSKFFDKYFNEIEKVYKKNTEKLTDITIPLILIIKDILGIKSKIIFSSNLNPQGNKSKLLYDICKKISADEYLSPIGSKNYIDEDDQFTPNNIKLKYQNFEHPIYNQLWGNFISHLSIIDLIFNEGEKSLDIIRSGRKEHKN